MAEGASSQRQLYAGLMSGTSLDGIDAVLVDFLPNHAGLRTMGTYFLPFEPAFRTQLLSLQSHGDDELHRASLAANRIARAYADSIRQLLIRSKVNPAEVVAIGAHGQTVRHRPELGYTIQLNNPALLAELTGIPVVADFRSRDISAGGQGAPLVPAFHRSVFGSSVRNRAIVNIGGIANLTYLPSNGTVLGFDTGPGNCLMDNWAALHLGRSYDEGGAWAASGTIVPSLLDKLLQEPYFAAPAPKSTGQDLFNATWLSGVLSSEAPQDVQATLCALTARTIVDALVKTSTSTSLDVFLCGGGAHNAQLTSLLRTMTPGFSWGSTDALGIPADWVEAVAFAWLARQFITETPANLPQVTGAAGSRILGALYPA